MGDSIFTRRFSIEGFNPIVATGGTITTVGNYKVHTFYSTGTSTFQVTNSGTNGELEYFIVAGGAGGGAHVGGGGGAGGVLQNLTTVENQSYTITVGNGGSRINTANSRGANGQNSSAFGVTSIGGGGGGSFEGSGTVQGIAGGSGGGAGGGQGVNNTIRQGGAGTTGQGFKGGNTGNRSVSLQTSGAPGGGAGQQGPDRIPSSNTAKLNGGDGVTNNWLGTTYWFAGGGGGGSYSTTPGGNGGKGGGGGGASHSGSIGLGDTNSINNAQNGVTSDGTNSYGSDGAVNSGGGGAGGGGGSGADRSSAGGSGIVIIRYSLVKVD